MSCERSCRPPRGPEEPFGGAPCPWRSPESLGAPCPWRSPWSLGAACPWRSPWSLGVTSLSCPAPWNPVSFPEPRAAPSRSPKGTRSGAVTAASGWSSGEPVPSSATCVLLAIWNPRFLVDTRASSLCGSRAPTVGSAVTPGERAAPSRRRELLHPRGAAPDHPAR